MISPPFVYSLSLLFISFRNTHHPCILVFYVSCFSKQPEDVCLFDRIAIALTNFGLLCAKMEPFPLQPEWKKQFFHYTNRVCDGLISPLKMFAILVAQYSCDEFWTIKPEPQTVGDYPRGKMIFGLSLLSANEERLSGM